MCNINLNQGDGEDERYFELSQTLFNKDAAYEYIMPKYKLGTSTGVPNGTLPENYGEVITSRSYIISEPNEVVLEGFQIVSESGDIVSDITFGDGFECNSGDLESAQSYTNPWS